MNAQQLPFSNEQRVYQDITGTIGKTPLIQLNKLGADLPNPLFAKVEFFNPSGSIKDRIASNIIDDAEKKGLLKPGGTVVESTSGNTGAALAIICAQRGYKCVFVMPDKMSLEKIQLLRAFGGKVVITPTSVAPDDPRSYYKVADRIVAETPNSILANQYHNPQNPESHYQSTGPEIWEQTEGMVTDVVIGMGTGGTISGVGRYLKEQNPNIKIVGVDPTGSILKEIWENDGKIPEGVKAVTYKVEGVGEDFLPSTTDLSVVDEIVRVTDKESFLWTRRLVIEEGIFAGGSSGFAIAGAVHYAKDLPKGRLVVVILPDSGSRYLSKIFDDKWMRENGYLESDWNELTLREVLQAKESNEMVFASEEDSLSDVIEKMKSYDISQLPVAGKKNEIVGMVREVDLLKQLLDSKNKEGAKQSIQAIMQKAPPTLPAYTRMGDAIQDIVKHNVVIVSDGNELIGILSKIDALDFIQN